ncbi:MAG TPA: hypothetical protein VFN76_06545, partial [Candidatus Limnocylindria bacterium]|nr:hypothetical protein [Candidatus Limnocylindria bacterium]
PDAHAHADTHTDANPDAHAHTDANPDAHAHADTHTDANAHTDTHTDANAHTDTHTDANAHTDANPDARTGRGTCSASARQPDPERRAEQGARGAGRVPAASDGTVDEPLSDAIGRT